MFEFFFGRRNPKRLPDRVWVDSQRRRAGVLAELDSAKDRAVVLTAPFGDTIQALASGFRLSEPASARPGAICLWNWKGKSPRPKDALPADLPPLLVVAFEHHPLPEIDQELIAYFRDWPSTVELRFHGALDEPLIATFGDAQRIVSLLRQLGMREDEPVEGGVIGEALLSAQRKIAKAAPTRHEASSARDWFRLNRP